ncbi:MAG: choice-of-anchor J domain-containing protein [Muribaculaceae bacterium]|nr:choice-of-anchor J domain-containing protein [Muribaculaceae bacterium]
MFKPIKYMMSLIAALMVLVSCDSEYSQPPVNLPEGGIGTGAWDSPMTAYQCLLGSVNPDRAEAWVTGYIVGVVNTEVGNVLNERCAQFEGPFTVNTNLLIAMNPGERDWEKCATVQLPSGSVRSALNLTDHPDNLDKLVTIKGTTGEKYCGAYGIRSASDFNWGDQGKEEVELDPVEGPFFQNFSASTSFDPYAAQGWKNVMVSGGLSGWYVRDFDNNNYITTSAYLGTQTGGPYENWLISPAIDMSKLTEKTLEFETMAAYAVENPENCLLEVYVMTTDNPATSTSTRLNAVIAVPTGSAYTAWVKSGKLDLSSFEGTVRIGWRYWSKEGGSGYSATYCLDNISVGGATEPETPVVPPAGGAVYEGLTTSAEGWTYDNALLPSGVSSVWKWDSNGYLKGTAFNGSAQDCESTACSPVISLAGLTGARVEFEHTAKFQTTLRELCAFVVREAGTAEWTVVSIPTWPAAGSWTFVGSGSIDISAFDGKEIEIGFRYGSSTAGADTWEVKNVKVTASK